MPKGVAVHYISETGIEFGPDNTFSLLRAFGDRGLVYHVEDMVKELGKVRTLPSNPSSMERTYRKQQGWLTLVKNMERSWANDKVPMLINYCLLTKMYEHHKNNMVVYHEWNNIRKTMWKTLGELGPDRNHFIRFKLPDFIPSREEFNRYSSITSIKLFESFGTTEALDLLELWKALNHANDPEEYPATAINTVPVEAAKKTYLYFLESGNFATINLGELLEWSKEEDITLRFHKFLDKLLELRAANVEVKTTDEDEKPVEQTAEDVENSAVDRAVADLGLQGLLTGPQQNAFKRMAREQDKLPNPFGEGTIADVTVPPEAYQVEHTELLNDQTGIIDKTISESSVDSLAKTYIDNVMEKDILDSLLAVKKGGVVVKGIKKKDIEDAGGKATEFSITIQPVGGNQSTVKMKIPVIEDDGTFTAGTTKYRLSMQPADMPIAKIKPNRVALSSYYGKCFVNRNDNAVNDYGRWIHNRVFKALNDPEDKSIVDVKFSTLKFFDVSLPREYTAIANTMRLIKTKDVELYFNYNALEEYFAPEELKHKGLSDNLVPVGRKGKDLLAIDMDGSVHNLTKGELLGPISNVIKHDLGTGPEEYAEIIIYSKRLPVILTLGYLLGFENALKKLGLGYEILPPGSRSPLAARDDVYKVRFRDMDFYIHTPDRKSRLIVAGLNSIRKISKGQKGAGLNNKNVYGTLVASNSLSRHHLREIDLMNDMFVDPITADVLKQMDEPTEFIPLVLRAVELLETDYVPKEAELRYRGYERISGMMYTAMVDSIRGYRSQAMNDDAKININPNEVWLNILTDQSKMQTESINPLHSLKERETVTWSGAGGRSSKSIVRAGKVYRDRDVGVISEANPDSAKVGVRMHMAPNANIKNIRGLVDVLPQEDLGASNVLSTSALLAPGSTSDD